MFFGGSLVFRHFTVLLLRPSLRTIVKQFLNAARMKRKTFCSQHNEPLQRIYGGIFRFAYLRYHHLFVSVCLISTSHFTVCPFIWPPSPMFSYSFSSASVDAYCVRILCRPRNTIFTLYLSRLFFDATHSLCVMLRSIFPVLMKRL